MLFIRKSPLALLLSGLYATSVSANLYFPPEMISVEGNEVADLAQLKADGKQFPGVYEVDIYINQTFYNREYVHFHARDTDQTHAKDDTGLVPCLSRKSLASAGVKTEFSPELMSLDENQCINPEDYMEGVFSIFDFSHMRLEISVPQMLTRNTARDNIDPSLWDEGIHAALVNYNFSGSNRYSNYGNDSSYFLSLNSGLNLGGWRLRDDRSWNYYDSRYGTQQQWQRMRTYAERAIIPFRSRLVVGESTSNSDVFESLGFRGVQLSSDDNMLPDTLRGFAPVVRGVAESNAEVVISQNGYILYRTAVSPGAFEITDLSPVYSSGDLEVNIREAGGQVRIFTLPYSSLPSLQREGQVKYSLTAGNFRGSNDRYESPSFVQWTLMWGLPYSTTLYGGMQFSADYQALQSGAGINMGSLGALSADMTQANSTLADGTEREGQSLRFLYARSFNTSGTTLRLTGYRYSTRGFHTLGETALKNMSGRLNNHNDLDNYGQPVIDNRSDYYRLYDNRRSRFEANISQSLGEYGSLWMAGMRQTYWNTSSGSDSIQAGYSSSVGPVSYSLNYSYSQYRNHNAASYKESTIGLSLSVPLDRLFSRASAKPVYATLSGNRDSNGRFSQQSGLSGQLLTDNNLSWNVSQGHNRSQETKGSTSGNASLYYRGTYGNSSAGYSYNRDTQQFSYGLSGGVLLHEGGLTIGQPLGDTAVLIATPGVSGVSLKSEPGISTDWRGYTIKPYVSAYRKNRIQIDMESLDEHTDIESPIAQVIPTHGAVVRTEFKARRGYRVLMQLMHDDKPLPFGTIVSTAESSGIVADGGQVYLSGMAENGEVSARWGEGSGQHCRASYRLKPEDLVKTVIRISGNCQ